MSGGEVDPAQWIELIGKPMQAKVDGLQRAMWWATGGAMWAGVILGLIAPYVLKKLGLA